MARLGCMLLLFAFAPSALAERRTENVIVVTLDGFRWQELFTGADEVLLDAKVGGVRDLASLKSRYWKETPTARREALMPFIWDTVVKQGQIFGNPLRRAPARCTNGLKFSYPGYSEMFCGIVDARIDSNAKRDNPNLSVLEFLNERDGCRGRVEAMCTWAVFPWIFRSGQNKLPVHAGWSPLGGAAPSERERNLNDVMDRLPRYWPDNVFDVFAMEAARIALDKRRPRVLYIALGETDEWGHGRRYDLYLDAAHKSDRFLAQLWHALQQHEQYRDRTTLIVTTDHGRGLTRLDWTDHGKGVLGAEYIWIAVLGPDTPARGERERVEATQSQVAATIAAALGHDFRAASPKAAAPLPVFAEP